MFLLHLLRINLHKGLSLLIRYYDQQAFVFCLLTLIIYEPGRKLLKFNAFGNDI